MTKKKNSWKTSYNEWLIPKIKPEGCDPYEGGYEYSSM